MPLEHSRGLVTYTPEPDWFLGQRIPASGRYLLGPVAQPEGEIIVTVLSQNDRDSAHTIYI